MKSKSFLLPSFPASVRTTLRRLAVPVMAAVILCSTAGCFLVVAGAAAGVGATAYVEGQLTVTLDKPYDRVVTAANSALSQLEFVRISETRDALSDTLIARNAQDQRVSVLIQRQGEGLTHIEIRVGTFGDKDVSQVILDHIRSNL